METWASLTALAASSSFNSATAHRPWKPSRARRPCGARAGFNSATAHRPWKQVRGVPAGRGQEASIRPRHIGRGNRRSTKLPHPAEKSFNSATAHRPWKPSTPVCGSRRNIGDFNSATAHRPWKLTCDGKPASPTSWLQFGHGTSAVETPPGATTWVNLNHSFNSATAHRPWKPNPPSCRFAWPPKLQFGHGTSAVETSSRRGPRAAPSVLQFGHGTSAVETRIGGGMAVNPVALGFNSATAHRPWKPSQPACPRGHQPGQLQFGHGTSAVETLRRSAGWGGVQSASIRPRHIGRGNIATAAKLHSHERLQFGHGTSAVETPPSPVCRHRETVPRALQFGHGTSAVET